MLLYLWIHALLSTALAADVYPDFKTLATHEQAGVDYRIESVNRGACATVMAIHGGLIETGTSEIARAIAGSVFNLYLFEGIKPEHNHVLHITSRHFDEPEALALADRSDLCVSIHGFDDSVHSAVCIGGSHEAMGLWLEQELLRAGLPLEAQYPCSNFPAPEPDNIVNRCRRGGVQLELSAALRRQLLASPEFMDAFARVISGALREFSSR